MIVICGVETTHLVNQNQLVEYVDHLLISTHTHRKVVGNMDVDKVLKQYLVGLDNDILDYLVSSVDSLSIEDRKLSSCLSEIIVPFLMDSSYVGSEDIGNDICKQIAISFGGSGFKLGVKTSTNNSIGINSNSKLDDDLPVLLSAPVKIINTVFDVINPKHTYGGVVLQNDNADDSSAISSNLSYQASAIPVTQKQIRKQRKENEALQKILRAEAHIRALADEELRKARMAAIKASRTASRQANNGVNIDRFSIPHPSGTGELLTDVSLVLAPTRRYALVGRNGAGKSTLLRALANYKFACLHHLRILLVDQHVEGDDDSAINWLLRADVERTALLEDEVRLNNYLHCDNSDEIPDDLKGINIELALTECYERMDAIGASSAEARARKILLGLGFDLDMMDKPTNSLSGGWAMRAALAAAIFVNPNLLLLDEPTNHLDLHALVWLENWLTTRFEGIVLVVSHDRYFLNTICTDVLELRSKLGGQSKSSLEHYSGDYETYEHTLSENKKVQQRARDAYEKEKEKLREFIAREGKKYDNPAHQAQRKMKVKQLESMIEVEMVEEDSEVVIHLPKGYGIFDDNEKLLGINDVSFSWTSDTPVLFERVDFCVQPRARIAIMGKNGCGKTSLLNILMGESSPTTGTVSKHLGCRIQMLQQHHYRGEQLDPNLNSLEHIQRMRQDESTATGFHDPGTRQEETSQRSYLSNFGITGNRALLPVKYLSGGQRMRVALAVALFTRPDLLVLDEPTNHLDSHTVAALCQALETYNGAIIAVSHDESFVNQVINNTKCDKQGNLTGGELWILSKQRLHRYDGTFAQYKKQIMNKVLSESGMQ